MSLAAASLAPPETVLLAYRLVGRTHVFTADGFRGFHIGSSDLRRAFDSLEHALGLHISLSTGEEAAYGLESSFESFDEQIRTHASASLQARRRR